MRYVLGIFAIFVVIILVVVMLFRRSPAPDTQQGNRTIDVSTYADKSAVAVYTIEGALNAEENHRAIRISVDSSQRKVEILSGYNRTVTGSQTFTNNQAAYGEFLHGLKNAGFGLKQEAEYKEEKGVCPLGNRNIYQLQQYGQDLTRTWSSSCAKTDGSFGGNTELVRQLFQKQIPDYTSFVRNVSLSR